ncbi:MAG TPA: hypothetical protein VGH44_01540 [Candidatus Saccharimonadia bacterium]|jgi:alpha-amylase/alpha-mannosidase (GH57 family)
MWANLLHFYQPHGQKRQIIDMITAQCYRPVAEGLLANRDARVTINFTGVLLEQLDQAGHGDVIDMYTDLVRRGQVELVGSGKYHAILPLLPLDEARRQVEENTKTNRKYFGSDFKPRGVFLPEMAWDPKLAPMLEELGFEWVVLDELAARGSKGGVDWQQTYTVTGSSLKAVFREHRLSTMLAWISRDAAHLKAEAKEELVPGRYVVTAMDGEVFGHHRAGHDRALFEMLSDPEIGAVKMSEVFDKFPPGEALKTTACTWASSEDDIAKGIQFISWDDPHNRIHQLQWELLRLAVEQVDALPHDEAVYRRLRQRLDPAVASDQFYWAAGKPWWMIEYIERGAHDLLTIIQEVPGAETGAAQRGLALYREIMELAYDWQRSGKIDSPQERPRIPFKERTLEAGDRGTWEAFVDMMRHEEKRAAERGSYEEAILWRDAVNKLEQKLDMYDAVHAVDLIRQRLPHEEIEDTIAQYKARYNRIRGGQLEQRSN